MFSIPSWNIIEIPIFCTFMMLVCGYLYVQQMSHRFMTGLGKDEYIQKHCSGNPREWLQNEIMQLVAPYTYIRYTK